MVANKRIELLPQLFSQLIVQFASTHDLPYSRQRLSPFARRESIKTANNVQPKAWVAFRVGEQAFCNRRVELPEFRIRDVLLAALPIAERRTLGVVTNTAVLWEKAEHQR